MNTASDGSRTGNGSNRCMGLASEHDGTGYYGREEGMHCRGMGALSVPEEETCPVHDILITWMPISEGIGNRLP